MYKPSPVPQDPKLLNSYLEQELNQLSTTITSPVGTFGLPKIFAVPTNPFDGQIVYAVSPWNPGSGNGIYVYKVNTWVFLG